MQCWHVRRSNANIAMNYSVDGVRFVYLKGDYNLIEQRLQARRGHFASDSILKSQFEDLEQPDDAITVEIDKKPEAIVSEIIARLKSSAGRVF